MTENNDTRTLAYSTESGGQRRFHKPHTDQFTVITADKVYRIAAASEARVRSAFTAAGIPVLGVEKDAEVAA